MSDIFISYAREDKAKAKILAGALEDHGFSVWWDPKIPLGKEFSEVLEEELNKVKCVIVLWSKKSIKSRWVKNEAAEGNRRKILVPALIDKIDDTEIPLEFRRMQTARLFDWQENTSHPEFVRLLEAVRSTLDRTQSSMMLESALDEQEKDKKKWIKTKLIDSIQRYKFILSLTILLFLFFGVWYLWIKPSVLVFKGEQPVKKTESGYEASFDFDQSKPVPGLITFRILAEKDDKGEILGVSVETVGTKIGDDVANILQEGKEATLTYQRLGVTPHRLKLDVSDVPLTVEITSPQLKHAVTRTITFPRDSELILVYKGEQPVKKIKSGYEASFDFDQSKPVPGLITFRILAEENDKGKILGVSVETVGMKVGEDVPNILQEGKEATLTYQRLGVTPHRLTLTVSDVPLTVKITSPQLSESITRTINF